MAVSETSGRNLMTEIVKKERSYLSTMIRASYVGYIVSIDLGGTVPTCKVQPKALHRYVDPDTKKIKFEKKNMIEKAMIAIPFIETQYKDTQGKKHLLKPRIRLKLGDDVIVAVLDDDSSYYTKGGTFRVDNTHPHSMEDSVVIARIATKDDWQVDYSEY